MRSDEGLAGLSRRGFLTGLAAAPFALVACTGTSSVTRRGAVAELAVQHDGRAVRCLYHDRLISGERAGCLAIVLLHGSGADASQWFDIGLAGAVERLRLGPDVHRIVAIAPDIADHDRAASLVEEAVFPALDHEFAAGMLAISGISRGAAEALEVARRPKSAVLSVGLHSPAVHLDGPIEPVTWTCFVDVGDDDSLADDAGRTAATLRSSGVEVAEHHWAGRHDRSYWRRHLPDYLAFHAAAAQRSRA